MKFQVGDQVRLGSGTKSLTVVSVYGNNITARYNHSGTNTTRYYSDFVAWDEEEQKSQSGEFSMKGDLFKTKDEPVRFGTGLTLDSQGNYVLEMKDGGGVATFKKQDLIHVMPFTYSVKFANNNTEYQFLGKEGSVEVGDFLITLDSNHKMGGMSVGEVTAVNTKSKKAKSYFKGAKLQTIPLTGE